MSTTRTADTPKREPRPAACPLPEQPTCQAPNRDLLRVDLQGRRDIPNANRSRPACRPPERMTCQGGNHGLPACPPPERRTRQGANQDPPACRPPRHTTQPRTAHTDVSFGHRTHPSSHGQKADPEAQTAQHPAIPPSRPANATGLARRPELLLGHETGTAASRVDHITAFRAFSTGALS